MSDELTPEEIVDVEASEKEFKEGKCKTFRTVKAFLDDLHKSDQTPENCGTCRSWHFGKCKQSGSFNYLVKTAENCWCDKWSEK